MPGPLPGPPVGVAIPDTVTLDLEEGDGGSGPTPPSDRIRLADALEAGGALKEAERLRGCGTEQIVLACDQGHPYVVTRGCDDRNCPDCQRRLAHRSKEKVRRGADKARCAGLRQVHVVLTVPNVLQLACGTLDDLHRALAALWRQRPVRRRLAGLYRRTEVVRADDGRWHPHVHALVALAHGYVDYGELLRDLALRWHGLTGCTPDCPAKRATLEHEHRRRRAERDAGGSWDGAAWDAANQKPPGCARGGSAWLGDVHGPDDDPSAAIEEVCKYITKPLALLAAQEPDGITPDAAQVALAIRGRRLGLGYGVYYRLPRGDEPAPACCRTCERHNDRVRRAWEKGTDPGPDPSMSDPDAAYVDPALRYEGTPLQVWRRARAGDRRAHRIVHSLRQEHPELWGDALPPDT